MRGSENQVVLTALRISCKRMNVEVATNERRDSKPRPAETRRGLSGAINTEYRASSKPNGQPVDEQA